MRWLSGLEWLALALVTLVSLALHLRFVTNVGGLWRDETNSLNLSTLPRWGDVWHFLDYDSFPVLFFAVLRTWAGIFGADNDTALRVLGLLTGLGVIGALWWNARSLGARGPVLSLALIGLNPMFIRYGDSTRAYGLGIILILLTFRSFWRLVELPSVPSVRRIVAATFLALLSVHCLYYNSVLLLAIAAGAVAVALRAKAWRTVGIVLGIGMVAAASLLPYVPMMRRMHEWTFMVNFPVDFPWLWKRVGEVIGSPDPLSVWLWVALFIFGIGMVVAIGVLNRQKPIPAAVLFSVVALAVGVVGYAAFLKTLNYYTQPWYYVTIVAFAACTLEIIFGAWPLDSLAARSVRVGVAIWLLGLAAVPAWEELPTRHTNVDLLSAKLSSLAAKGDVIVVPRWECAITLCRYYRGPAEVITLPPIKDHRFHRYDLVLNEMMTPDSLHGTMARLEETLRSGHHVFIVGKLPFPPAEYSPPIIPPAYRDANGQFRGGGSYHEVWQLQVGHFLKSHATHGTAIDVPLADRAPVQGFEKLELGMVEGWR